MKNGASMSAMAPALTLPMYYKKSEQPSVISCTTFMCNCCVRDVLKQRFYV